jgi:hypothetical protein
MSRMVFCVVRIYLMYMSASKDSLIGIFFEDEKEGSDKDEC